MVRAARTLLSGWVIRSLPIFTPFMNTLFPLLFTVDLEEVLLYVIAPTVFELRSDDRPATVLAVFVTASAITLDATLVDLRTDFLSLPPPPPPPPLPLALALVAAVFSAAALAFSAFLTDSRKLLALFTTSVIPVAAASVIPDTPSAAVPDTSKMPDVA